MIIIILFAKQQWFICKEYYKSVSDCKVNLYFVGCKLQTTDYNSCVNKVDLQFSYRNLTQKYKIICIFSTLTTKKVRTFFWLGNIAEEE